MHPQNLFENLDHNASEEQITALASAPGWHLQRIVSTGQATPAGNWYDQEQNEWVVLLSGKARLRFQDPDETVDMTPGDWLNIPAHRRHRVESTAPDQASVWIALHFDETPQQGKTQ